MKFGSTTCNPFITLACDFQCPYCITKQQPGYDFGYPHHPAAEWAAALNGLEDVEQIVFNGGEPTLRPDFPELIGALTPTAHAWPTGWKIAIGSNGSPRARQVLGRITPRADLIIDLSFHPSEITLPDLVSTALALRDRGHNVRVHTVAWPGHGVISGWMVEQLQALRIDAFVQAFDGWYEGAPQGSLAAYPGELPACDPNAPVRRARCYRTIYTPIGPDGSVHICHTGLYARAKWSIIGNIFEGWISDTESIECNRYGRCNSCDRPRRTEVL